MKHTKKITCCAMLSALGVAVLYVASLLGAIDLDLTISAFTSLFVIFTVIEMGQRWAYMLYGATSMISLLILPLKSVAAMYLLFCGIYPILKLYFEKLPKILSLVVKLVYFNLAMTGTLLAAKFIFKIEIYSGIMLALFYGVANLAFVIFDILLSRMITLYLLKYRKKLKIDKLLK